MHRATREITSNMLSYSEIDARKDENSRRESERETLKYDGHVIAKWMMKYSKNGGTCADAESNFKRRDCSSLILMFFWYAREVLTNLVSSYALFKHPYQAVYKLLYNFKIFFIQNLIVYNLQD